MFESRTVFLVAVLGFSFAPGASAQGSAEQNLGDCQRLGSQDSLCKPQLLTPPQRASLPVVAGETLDEQQMTTGRLSQGSQPQSTPALIGSRIDGEFTGWEGGTIFTLQNGQMWQQSSYAYACAYAYSPAVLIYGSGPVYKMRVEGLDSDIAVTRLK